MNLVPDMKGILRKVDLFNLWNSILVVDIRHTIQTLPQILLLHFNNIIYTTIKEIYMRNQPMIKSIF
jgi:hypothetical protein